MTNKIILTRGVPASGKSTWSKAWVLSGEKRARINRDNLRWMVGIKDGVGTYEQEQLVTEYAQAQARVALKKGYDIVVDETNLRAKNVKAWLKFAKANGAEVEFKDFFIPRYSAIQRDIARGARGEREVGAEVINSFFDRFMGKNDEFPAIPTLDEEDVIEFKPYIKGSIKAMSFDIDGTLAHMTNRGPYDTSKYADDVIDTRVREILWLAADAGYGIIILSGRSDEFEEVLFEWLWAHEIYPDLVLMRAEGDMRNDAIVKSELVDEHISGVYDIRMHFDDRNRVVDALRAKGMKVSQVEPGDF